MSKTNKKQVKKNNNKKIVIPIIIVSVLIVVYLIFKTILFFEFIKPIKDINFDEFKSKFELKETIDIKTRKLKGNETYLEFLNIKIKNDFDKYTIHRTSEDIDALQLIDKDENGEIKKAIIISKSISLVDIIKLESDGIKGKYVKSILEKNNIKTDIDLINYIKSIENTNFFSSTTKILDNYTKYYLYETLFPSFQELKKINGDYKGYFIDSRKEIKEAKIIMEDYCYAITFIDKNNFFTDEYINDSLNTLVIE